MMKSAIALCVLFVFILSTEYCSCSYWKKRMEKYGALVNCEYYATSESGCKEFFAFEDVATRNENNTLQIRFFTLSSEAIQFMLSEKNDGLDASSLIGTDSESSGDTNFGSPFYPSSTTTPRPFRRTIREESHSSHGRRLRRRSQTDNFDFVNPNDIFGGITTFPTFSIFPPLTTTVAPTTTVTPICVTKTPATTTTTETPTRANSNSDDNYYKFVFGTAVNNGYSSDTESYVSTGSKRLKSLLTPGIVRKNEPNEVLIEILSDGKIRATINENDAIELRVSNVDALKYICFSSTQQVLTEFFYNCKF